MSSPWRPFRAHPTRPREFGDSPRWEVGAPISARSVVLARGAKGRTARGRQIDLRVEIMGDADGVAQGSNLCVAAVINIDAANELVR